MPSLVVLYVACLSSPADNLYKRSNIMPSTHVIGCKQEGLTRCRDPEHPRCESPWIWRGNLSCALSLPLPLLQYTQYGSRETDIKYYSLMHT